MKRLFLLVVLLLTACSTATAQELRKECFGLRVVDEQTGRGVPLVELETVNSIRYVTDSAGWAAIDEPGLMGREVFFHVKSHGYEFPKDGFGFRGTRVKMEPGGRKTVKVRRVNIAERMYRVTGQGIYRDSVLLGEPVPLKNPVISGGVTGQDSVVNAVYKGKLYWFWGDTMQAGYPLGLYSASGAVSDLPAGGGLEPSRGVDLRYFVDEKGFSRAMCPRPGEGPVWIYCAMVLREGGKEVMVCHFIRVKNLGEILERGIAVWNDEKEVFEKVADVPLDSLRVPMCQPVRVKDADGSEWFYFPTPYPVVRVRATLADVLDHKKYEGWTCLKPGSWKKEAGEIERDTSGKAVWGWKADTAAITVSGNLFGPVFSDPDLAGKGHLTLRDAESGKPIRAHTGSVCWNEYRKKWVMVALQVGGSSMLGEVWYAEADAVTGPWADARKVVTHDKYSYYNVKQHPYFDEEGGRYIYFEGTYTAEFSGNDHPTQRYNYNQVMYRLDLSDERLRAGQAKK